jgi:hypothetical protein
MEIDSKARYERSIFGAFAVDAGLRVAPASIRSSKPPHPDITCRTGDGYDLAFELVV